MIEIIFIVLCLIPVPLTYWVAKRHTERRLHNLIVRQAERFVNMATTVSMVNELTAVAGGNPRHYNCEQRIQLRVLLKQLQLDLDEVL